MTATPLPPAVLLVSAVQGDHVPGGVEVSDPDCPFDIGTSPSALAWAAAQGWGADDPHELIYVLPDGAEAPAGSETFVVGGTEPDPAGPGTAYPLDEFGLRPFQGEVHAGIGLLDREGPQGWRDRIDPAAIGADGGVLHQVFRGSFRGSAWRYGDMLATLGLTWRGQPDPGQAKAYGFDTGGPPPVFADDGEAAAELAEEWRRQL